MPYTYSFEKLDVWQDSRILVRMVYLVTKNYPESQRHSLANQMQRAAVSVSSNIAEGASRSSSKEQIRFYEIAFGSITELYCQAILSNDLGFTDEKNFIEIKEVIQRISNKLNSLCKSIRH